VISRFFEFLAWLHGDKPIEEVCEEWHSFWVGFYEMICLRIPPVAPMSEHTLKEIDNEWHYYGWGRACGVLLWVIILVSFTR